MIDCKWFDSVGQLYIQLELTLIAVILRLQSCQILLDPGHPCSQPLVKVASLPLSDEVTLQGLPY